MRVAAVKRFRAWLLLATFVASFGSSSLPLDHFGLVDTACGDVSLSAGVDEVRFTTPPQALQHCPVCHYLRAVSGATASAPVRLAMQPGRAIEFVPASVILLTVDPVTQPSRGPPAPTPTFVL